MPNPKLETYKNKATGTVYDYTDAAAQAALADILDGTDIDSFSDVESALADKVDKVTGKGLSTNDYDNTEKAKVAGAFPRSEQAVLGAKNWFYSGKITDGQANITDTDNGKTIRIHNETAGTYKMGIFQMPVEKNTDYIFTTTVDWTSGVGNVGIASENPATDIKVYGQITSDKDVEVKFNSGNNSFIHVKLLCTWSDSVVGDVTYTNNMLRLASDPDDTYAPYAMTNKELTEKVTPKTIPVTTDSRTLTKEGVYRYETIISIGSSSDINLPTEMENKGVTIVVRRINVGLQTTNTLQQIAYVNNQGYFFMRPCNANNWGSWYKFTGTVVS